MTLLTVGVALWWFAHLFRRIAPGPRAALGEGPGKGAVALFLVIAIVLMVVGYQNAGPLFLYVSPGWTWHLNNLLMLASIALLGMGSSKGRARTWLRHPMLTGVLVWAVAHLLVNGDVPSLALFGGLGLWAIVEMVVI
ncbi:MAG TPA: NnrU family protein, partial [Paracoccaceae bacterium]|nr:NnrU family protein [Paracoccaceae bacterium]